MKTFFRSTMTEFFLFLDSSLSMPWHSVLEVIWIHWLCFFPFCFRFIQTYGTHIIVGLAVGGQDIICIKQRPSSGISPADLRCYLEDLGDHIFSDGRSPLLERNTRDGKQKVYCMFYCFLLHL